MGIKLVLVHLLLLQKAGQLGIEAALELVVKLGVAEAVLLLVAEFVAVLTQKVLKLALRRGNPALAAHAGREPGIEAAGWPRPSRAVWGTHDARRRTWKEGRWQ